MEMIMGSAGSIPPFRGELPPLPETPKSPGEKLLTDTVNSPEGTLINHSAKQLKLPTLPTVPAMPLKAVAKAEPKQQKMLEQKANQKHAGEVKPPELKGAPKVSRRGDQIAPKLKQEADTTKANENEQGPELKAAPKISRREDQIAPGKIKQEADTTKANENEQSPPVGEEGNANQAQQGVEQEHVEDAQPRPNDDAPQPQQPVQREAEQQVRPREARAAHPDPLSGVISHDDLGIADWIQPQPANRGNDQAAGGIRREPGEGQPRMDEGEVEANRAKLKENIDNLEKTEKTDKSGVFSRIGKMLKSAFKSDFVKAVALGFVATLIVASAIAAPFSFGATLAIPLGIAVGVGIVALVILLSKEPGVKPSDIREKDRGSEYEPPKFEEGRKTSFEQYRKNFSGRPEFEKPELEAFKISQSIIDDYTKQIAEARANSLPESHIQSLVDRRAQMRASLDQKFSDFTATHPQTSIEKRIAAFEREIQSEEKTSFERFAAQNPGSEIVNRFQERQKEVDDETELIRDAIKGGAGVSPDFQRELKNSRNILRQNLDREFRIFQNPPNAAQVEQPNANAGGRLSSEEIASKYFEGQLGLEESMKDELNKDPVFSEKMTEIMHARVRGADQQKMDDLEKELGDIIRTFLSNKGIQL